MTRQYAACVFHKDATRTYTYHFDGDALQKGDVCEVDGRDGKSQVTVHSVSTVKPGFATKPILRLIRRPDPAS